MKWVALLGLCGLVSMFVVGLAVAQDPYRERRERLMAQVSDGVLLVRGAAESGVNHNFFYLTGIGEPRGVLLLAPNGVRTQTGRQYPGPDYVRGRIVKEILFLPASDPLAARWGEDSKATLDSVDAGTLGVDVVMDTAGLNSVLAKALESEGVFRYVRSAEPTLSGSGNPDTAFVAEVRDSFFGARIEDATPLVEEMRRLKDTGEVQAIRKSIEITGQGLRKVMRMARPGMHEYQLEAELTRLYRANDGTHAFDPIVAAGPNAVLLHYKENEDRIEEGRLILIDTGVSIGGYKADISRTFPVGGKFTERQREIYETVLRAQEEAIALCKPGALMADIHAKAYEVIEAAGFGQYFVHGTSHHLGLETHDVGDVHRPLEPGAVITVEPGIYIAEEGIGVRIEDDIVITPDGHENMSSGIPRSVEEIEDLLAGR